MKANIGTYDCAIRFVVGCVVLAFGHHGLGWWAALGLVPILTSLSGFCPLYRLVHVDTKAWELAHEHHHDSKVRKL